MNSIVGTTIYAFPADMIQVRTIYYDSKKLKFFKRTEYDEFVNENDPQEEQSGTPWLFTRWGVNFQLYPKPDVVETIKLLYLQKPVVLTTETDDIPLPDAYFSRVVEYCLTQAYQTDEDWEAALQMDSKFQDGLMRLKEHESVPTTEYFPSITTLPEDSGYGY